jgi:hypothetical protein
MEKGVIGIIDILGFKGIWTRESPAEIIKKWNSIIDNLNKNVDTFANLTDDEEDIKYEIRTYSFSDSIIITISTCNYQSLITMCGIMGDIFSIALDLGIFFRGAVSLGDFYSSDNMVIGPAVDDAADWYDKTDWAGIHLTPQASYFIDHAILDGEKKENIKHLITKYEIPLKNGKTLSKNWVVSWPAIFLKYDENGKKTSLSDFRKHILEIFSNNPIGSDFEKKYSNTIDFFEYIIDNID